VPGLVEKTSFTCHQSGTNTLAEPYASIRTLRLCSELALSLSNGAGSEHIRHFEVSTLPSSQGLGDDCRVSGAVFSARRAVVRACRPISAQRGLRPQPFLFISRPFAALTQDAEVAGAVAIVIYTYRDRIGLVQAFAGLHLPLYPGVALPDAPNLLLIRRLGVVGQHRRGQCTRGPPELDPLGRLPAPENSVE